MNGMNVLTFVMALALVLAFLWFAKTIYRLVVFRLTTDHRETILNGACLLDDDKRLSDREIRAVAVAVRHLYDNKTKSYLARGTYEYVKSIEKLPKPSAMKDEVRQVSKAFASLVLAENPIYAILIMKVMIDRRAKMDATKQSALTRAEITVASRLPTIDDETCHLMTA